LYFPPDFRSKSDSELGVTVTASGFISIDPEILDDSTARITSHSSGPVDAVVQYEDGRTLLTYSGLLPGGFFDFEYVEPCTVVASAS
jgi:hypothetical protein